MSTDYVDQSGPGNIAPSAPVQQEGQLAQPLIQRPQNNFALWVKNNEVSQETARCLVSVLTRVKIVLLVDDSSSMGSVIVEPGAQTNLFATSANQKTRWMEAQQAAITLVNMITALPNQWGFDVWFLNRGKVTNVHKPSDLQAMFAAGPSAGTPLVATLREIFSTYSDLVNRGVPVLLLPLSDGEPSGSYTETIDNLFYTLSNKHVNYHVSFIECNDNEEEMAYMDSLDGRILNFHNSDDYRLELARVKAQQGNSFKYTYTDYIISAVLSTFIPSYFMLDQAKTSRCSITPLPEMPNREIDAYLEGIDFVNKNATQIQPSAAYLKRQVAANQLPSAQPVYTPPPAPPSTGKCCTIL